MKRAPAPALPVLQHWMQAVITHPRGVVAGVESAEARRAIAVAPDALERVVLPSRTLGPAERLGIYSEMYAGRLVDSLRDDFPALAYVLGPARFEKLVRSYIAACPSTHFSLNQLGARLARHVAASSTRGKSFLAELAALERGIQEVFDEQASTPVTAAELEAVPGEDWPNLRLMTAPALRLFAFRHPVNRFYQAFREERRPSVPALRATWTVVYRKDWRVWRSNLTREQHHLLAGLMRGESLGSVLETCSRTRGVDQRKLERSLGAWFHEWMAEGLFVGLSSDSR